MPIHAVALSSPQLRTTRRLIEGVFDVLASEPDLHPHLEVETYTWRQLPDGLRADNEDTLHAGLVRELTWVESELKVRDLL